MASIWTYEDLQKEELPFFVGVTGHVVRSGTEGGKKIMEAWEIKNCIYCGGEFHRLCDYDIQDIYDGTGKRGWFKEVFVCKDCGWWKAWKSEDETTPAERRMNHFHGAACLRQLDLLDIRTPLDEVRGFLLAKYEQRFTMHPRLFEETVASVFADLGFDVHITAYSNDGGIDAFLTKGEETTGVQVKRYRDFIQVEQIRALAGALVLKGLTKGVFVTTSTFTQGAQSAVIVYQHRGYKIELMDALKFYDALKIARREMFSSLAEFEQEFTFDHLQQTYYRNQ
jgi:restriction system protein